MIPDRNWVVAIALFALFALLALLALLALPAAAGCTTAPNASPASDEQSAVPSDLPRRDCPEAFVPPANSSLEVHPQPDRPAVLNRSSVREYVTEFERYYQVATRATNETTELTVNPQSVRVVDGTGDWYGVWFEAGLTQRRRPANGPENVGDGYITVTYFVDDTVAVRAPRAAANTTLSNASEGLVLDC